MICTICQNKFYKKKSVALSCGCKFHGQCIVNYMQRGNCKCPNCRQYHPDHPNHPKITEEEEDNIVNGMYVSRRFIRKNGVRIQLRTSNRNV